MPRNTTFNDNWISNPAVKDRNGDSLSVWCQRVNNDSSSAHCVVCSKTFSISNMGLAQIQAHADGKKHILNVGCRRGGQTFFKVHKPEPSTSNELASSIEPSVKSNENVESEQSTSSAAATCSTAVVSLVSPKGPHWIPASLDDKVKQAEILLSLKLVSSNYSFHSYRDIVEVCKSAFLDSEIAKHMQLGETKVAYTVVHGLAPYFKTLFINDCRAGSGYYTIHFDETTTRQVKKQLDLYISYWSEKWNKINTVYIDSVFLGHANADQIQEVMWKFIDEQNLNIAKLLQLSMDGPNVNLSLQRKMNANLIEKGAGKLIDIGTCSLHPVHTAFMKGIESLPFDVEQFSNDVFSWFKLSSARREDYREVQSEELLETVGEFFLRPVSSRWLSMEPVCRRLIEQYPVLKKYFLETIPRGPSGQLPITGDRYKRIKSALTDPSTLVYLNFIAFHALQFTPFLTFFQKSEPLVHILYDKLNELVRTLMLLFMKGEIVGTKEGKDLADVQCDTSANWLPRQAMDVGVGTKTALTSVVREDDRKRISCSFRTAFIKSVSYMQSRLPISNPILRDLQCLDPMVRKSDEAKRAFVRLCTHLNKVTKSDEYCDKVQAEWLVYMCERDSTVEQWSINHISDSSDICAYWNYISRLTDRTGDKKYVNIALVAKCALSLSHGNAAPERGFSVNNSLLSKERLSLGERTICAERIVKEAVRIFGSVASIPITRTLIAASRMAHAEYALQQEKEKKDKKAKEEEQRKLELETQEQKVLSTKKESLSHLIQECEKKESEHMLEQETAMQLISEASQRLSVSLKNNDLRDAKIAQVMLSSGNSKLQATNEQLISIREEKKKSEQKLLKLEHVKRSSTSVLDDYSAKKRK